MLSDVCFDVAFQHVVERTINKEEAIRQLREGIEHYSSAFKYPEFIIQILKDNMTRYERDEISRERFALALEWVRYGLDSGII